MTFRQELADNIREARMAHGMSQYELAQLIGLTDSCISQYETCKRLPSIHTMAIMSDLFQMSLDDLVPHVMHETCMSPNQMTVFDFVGDE